MKYIDRYADFTTAPPRADTHAKNPLLHSIYIAHAAYFCPAAGALC
jgi:hypothetical protein